MAKDTLEKLRHLVSMKTAIIKALSKDIDAAVRKVRRLERENEDLRNQLTKQQQEWWQQLDEDEAYVNDLLNRHERFINTKLVKKEHA